MSAEDLIYSEMGTYAPPHIPVKVATLRMDILRVRKSGDWVTFTARDINITPVGQPTQLIAPSEKEHIEINIMELPKRTRKIVNEVRHDPEHLNAWLEFDLYLTPTNYAMDVLYLVVEGVRHFIARTPLYSIEDPERGRL